MFCEIMREMRRPTDFNLAVCSANALMGASYVGIVAAAYGTHGASVAGFLPDSLPEGSLRTIVGLLLAYHTAVSYLLTAQPLHRAIHGRLFPATLDGGGVFSRAALHWALITLSMLLLAYVVANAVPFFADFQDLLGNLLGAPTVFGWPAFFYVQGRRQRGAPCGRADAFVCGVFLVVFLPAFTLLGTYNALAKIAADWAEAGAAPFQCT